MNDYNLGYLNGILNSFSELNGTSYVLNPLPKKKTINHALIEYFYNKNCDYEYELELIEEKNWVFLEKILLEHFFYFINDKKLNNEIYNNNKQEEFVNLFLNNLYNPFEVKKIYKLKLDSYRDIIIEFEDDSYYILELRILY